MRGRWQGKRSSGGDGRGAFDAQKGMARASSRGLWNVSGEPLGRKDGALGLSRWLVCLLRVGGGGRTQSLSPIVCVRRDKKIHAAYIHYRLSSDLRFRLLGQSKKMTAKCPSRVPWAMPGMLEGLCQFDSRTNLYGNLHIKCQCLKMMTEGQKRSYKRHVMQYTYYIVQQT